MKYKVGDRVVSLQHSFYFRNNINEPVGIIDEIDAAGGDSSWVWYCVYFTNKTGSPLACYMSEMDLDYAPSLTAWYAYPMGAREDYAVELVKKPGDDHPH